MRLGTHGIFLGYFRRSMPATHLAHGEGKIDLIGADQVEPFGSEFPAECHDAWRGTELAGAVTIGMAWLPIGG